MSIEPYISDENFIGYLKYSASSYRHNLDSLWSYPGWFTSELFVLRSGNLYGGAIKFYMQKNIIRLRLLTRLFQDFKLLFPLIKDYLKGTYREVSAKSIVIFIVALAYIISPIDLIPDYILGFGQIDDVAILGNEND